MAMAMAGRSARDYSIIDKQAIMAVRPVCMQQAGRPLAGPARAEALLACNCNVSHSHCVVTVGDRAGPTRKFIISFSAVEMHIN